MNKIKLGPVVDFNNYKEYFELFSKESQDKVLEVHILEKDLNQEFENKLIELRQFILSNEITHLSFHSVDRVMQTILFEEKNEEEKFQKEFQKDLEKYNFLIEGLKKFSNELNQEVLLVVHQGVKYDQESIQNLSINEVKELRKTLLEKAAKGFEKIKEQVKDSQLKIVLENSPQICASKPQEHIIDLCFEDFKERLGNNLAFVFDLSHAAMCVNYFKQDLIKFKALEALRDEQGNPPKSLQSIENYIKIAGNNICWLHLNDANGILGENEGQLIGVEGSIIHFKSVIKTIQKHIKNPVGIIEIVDSHKDYSLISKSLETFRDLSQVKIKDKIISDKRCFVIAEIASSHCGDKEKLKDIFKNAVNANADAIKFQIFSAKDLCSTKHPGLSDLQNIELSKGEWKEVFEYAKQFNTTIFADVFDEGSANLAEPHIDGFSIHASDISNPFLLKHVAKKGKPVFLYIGGSTLNEVEEAIKIVEDYNVEIVLVYGLQNFPTDINNVHLKRIKYLKKKFGLPVCYHDHTDAETKLAKDITVHAFAYGAQLVEKHITDNRSLQGFDYMSSLNPDEFKEMVAKVRNFEKIIGQDDFKLHEADNQYRKKMKKFIVAKQNISSGEILSKDNTTFKRVVDGEYHPCELNQIIGRKVTQDIELDAPIKNENVERKAVILVPTRMKSTRLPKKATLDLAGDTTIGQMLERLRHSKKAEVILCTSPLEEDKVLVEIAKENGIKWFAGSPDDVMDRFIKCAERENAEIIVRATGDNPVMDPELIDRQITYHIEQNADYTGVEEVPIGFNAEVVNLDTIKKARQHVRNPKDTEYMTWFIKDPKNFKVVVMPVDEEEKGNYRLTLDTPEDLEVIRKLYEGLGTNKFTIKEAVRYLKENPKITKINMDYKQIKQPPTLQEMEKKEIKFENAQ